MKIIFDLRSVGLGNNGGSFTLIKSGNALTNMGHDVLFADGGKIMNTWVKLKSEHRIIKRSENLPDADCIIATGYKSVPLTAGAPDRCGLKFHWIRGWETWQYSEQEIVEKILNYPTIKLVNGIGLKIKLKQLGIDSYLIRPGYDLETIQPLGLRGKNDTIILGGLNHQGKHVKIKRTEWIFRVASELKRKYGKKIQLWMFGMERLPRHNIVDHFKQNPSIEEKSFIYNNVDIWLSPSMLEGLHMPPAEAMMTECPVVGTNAEMSGTKDYLINGKTGIVTKNKIDHFIQGVEYLVENEDIRKQYGKNARQRILEIGNRKKNMNKMVNLFEKIKNENL